MAIDRVVLDVGGTKFVTTKKTLTAWTNFFDFSSKEQDGIFVDADPNAFAVLLSFMRNGSVESSHITDAVLKQAIQFQIHGFLSFVQTMDRIVLNIRGTRVETSKMVLIESSTFFRDKFSTSWATEMAPFLNQDPVAFGVCLEFMTRGHVEESKLSNDVLELAEFLGIETLLDAVKARICWMGTDERSISKFTEEYGSISNAITTCGGSLLSQQSPLTNLEYASVYLHKRSGAARTSLRLPFRACVYGNVSADLLRMGDTINVLNRLGKEGYALASPALQTSWRKEMNAADVPGLGRIYSHVLFVKQVPTDVACRRESVQSRIIQDNADNNNKIQPREFVALLRPAQEVHSSNAVRLAVPSSDSAPAYWAGTQLKDPPDPSFHGAVAWLTNHGFHSQEPILTEAFTCALTELNDESSWASVLVFSKRITGEVAQSDALPAIIESGSTTSSITDTMSLENGH